ncbi:MAG: Ig domain-containing protein [Lachnospiraceae bacterium]|nr:Ig domain-containing protein [Lachnospiraceae bacterium]
MRRKQYLKKQFGMFVVLFILILGVFIILPTQSESIQAAIKPKLNKQSVRLIKGQTTKLKLKGAKGTVKWKSSKKVVASVNKKGIVKARKKGKTQILAKYAGKTYKCKVWVETPKISKTSLILEVGQTETLTMQGTKQKVTWSSKQPEIAEVDSRGNITANTEGTTVIVAKVGSKKYVCVITVNAIQIQNPCMNITMSVKNGKITTMHTDIPITVFNDTDNSISVCDGYGIEKKIGTDWRTVYIRTEKDEEITEKNIVIDAKMNKEISCDISQIGYEYNMQPGVYRVHKAIYIEGQKQILYAEFLVEKAILDISLELAGADKIPVSQKSVSVILKNNAANPVLESYYKVQKKINGEWEYVDFGVLYPDVMETIASNEVRRDTIFLEEGEYKCQPGEYRISKFVGIEEENTTLYVYFEIVE